MLNAPNVTMSFASLYCAVTLAATAVVVAGSVTVTALGAATAASSVLPELALFLAAAEPPVVAARPRAASLWWAVPLCRAAVGLLLLEDLCCADNPA